MEIAIVIVNLILLFYFTRMAIHSRQVQVAGKLGPTWIITVFFVGIGIIRLFQNHSLFSIIQTVLIIAENGIAVKSCDFRSDSSIIAIDAACLNFEIKILMYLFYKCFRDRILYRIRGIHYIYNAKIRAHFFEIHFFQCIEVYGQSIFRRKNIGI